MSTPSIVTELRALLGPDVVLLHVRRGEKGPRWKGWQKTTLAHMANPAYLAQFANGCNVGALLGNASGGLCTVDIDDDAAAESFLALNPKLRDALLSRRLRGCNCWLRIIGSYPPSGKIRDADGQDVGEWRGTGCQTLIHGEAIDRKKGETQPTPYKITRKSHPVEIRFEEIVWPEGWVLPRAPSTPNDTRPLKVAPPESPVSFEEWRATITANFTAYGRPAVVCASVVGQLLLNDVGNPFALALVDVPSSGKTITLNFFALPELAYPTDSFTPASFVSHASNLKRNELATVDMLPRIRFRALIVRDLAPVFGAKEDDLVKSLGILTRVLDGEGLETDSGVHGKRPFDSAPTIRSKAFRGLVRNGGTLKTSEVEKILRCSNPTALKEMETLEVLGVADKVRLGPLSGYELRLAPQFSWFTSDECKSLCWPDLHTQAGNV